MAFLTGKHLSRRTFLNGMGVTMALPFLESMVPAGMPLAQTAAKPRTRLGCIYFPHGATMDKWTPAVEGSAFELTEILQPLEPFRKQVNIIRIMFQVQQTQFHSSFTFAVGQLRRKLKIATKRADRACRLPAAGLADAPFPKLLFLRVKIEVAYRRALSPVFRVARRVGLIHSTQYATGGAWP